MSYLISKHKLSQFYVILDASPFFAGVHCLFYLALTMYCDVNDGLSNMPFRNLVDYDMEIAFESAKIRIEKLMSDQGLLNFIKENKLAEIFNPDDTVSCEYYDEDKFIKLGKNKPNCLNMLCLNIVSLPKHGGELLYLLSSLETHFQVIVLTEIGARNISVVENLIDDYSFHYVLPKGNNYGGVGIYLCNSLQNVCVVSELALVRTCHCIKCNFESLFINFTFRNKAYNIAGIYNHPNGNESHFKSALEISLNKIENSRTSIVAGDMIIHTKMYYRSR